MRWLDVISYSVDMSLSKLGVGEGHGGLACYSPWGCKESDTTQRLNQTTKTTSFLLVNLILFFLEEILDKFFSDK